MERLYQLNDMIQDEIDNIEAQILQINARKAYEVQDRSNPFEQYSDEDFRRRFRLTKSVLYLHSIIKDELEPISTRIGYTLSALGKILITLRYYATAAFHRVSADCYGVSESTVCKIIPPVTEAIASLRERFIRMPRTDHEIELKKQEFYRVAGMPRVIGAIDGTLVRIKRVGGMENKTDLFCRKQ